MPDPESHETVISDSAVPEVYPGYMVRWEEQENAHLLLYPEGIVKLNTSGGRILMHCDGQTDVAGIVEALEGEFQTTGIREEVHQFLEVSHAKGWIRLTP